MSDVDESLVAIAGGAFRRTRFYGTPYEEEPADASEVPVYLVLGLLPGRRPARLHRGPRGDDRDLAAGLQGRQPLPVRRPRGRGRAHPAATANRACSEGPRRRRASVILVEHCNDRPIDDLDYPPLLHADELDLIGSRAAGREWFDDDAEQLRIELNPASLLSHVSKRRFTCFPLVRYGVGRRIPTAEVP